MTGRVLVVNLAAASANWALPEWGYRFIRERTPADWTVRYVMAPTVSDGDGGAAPSAEALEAIVGAEVYFGFGIPAPLFRAADRLRWVQSAAAGIGAMLYPEMLESRVVLTNAAGIHAVPIGEHVVGGVIHFLRGFDVAAELHRAGSWDKRPFVAGDFDAEGVRGRDAMVREVGECRVLVVGTGGLGEAIATRLSALGAECIGLRRRAELGAPPGFARVASLDALDDELPEADVVVLAAAHTPETRHLMTAERLDRMSRSAILVNVARGALVDEAALAERLRDGRLRGAVLDVFQHEPLAAESPLWQLRNVLLTPHVSAVSPRRFWKRTLDLFDDNWRRWRSGEPLRNVVDKQAGY